MRIAPQRSSQRSGPAAVGARHRAFLGRLHRGRRVALRDAVELILRRARVVVRVVRGAALRLRIDMRSGPVVQTTAIALHGLRERSVERHAMLAKTRVLERVRREHTLETMLVTTRVPAPPAGVPGPAGGAATPLRQARREGAAPRLPMAIARLPAAVPARADAPAPAQVAGEAALRERAHRSPATAWVLPAEELSRVTDHVLRTFDRRVLSYRERTGQV